jgi:hypothetical protein
MATAPVLGMCMLVGWRSGLCLRRYTTSPGDGDRPYVLACGFNPGEGLVGWERGAAQATAPVLGMFLLVGWRSGLCLRGYTTNPGDIDRNFVLADVCYPYPQNRQMDNIVRVQN